MTYTLSTPTAFSLLAHLGALSLNALLLALLVRRGAERRSRFRLTMRGQLIPAAIALVGLLLATGQLLRTLVGVRSGVVLDLFIDVCGVALPALVLHLSMHRRAAHFERASLLVLAAYALVVAALIFGAVPAAGGQATPAWLMGSVTLALAALTVVALLLDVELRNGATVVASAYALLIPALLFAMRPPAAMSWQLAAAVAPILLPYTLLHRRFPFALADVFLKRVVALASSAAIAAAVVAALLRPLFVPQLTRVGAVAVIALSLLTAITYGLLRRVASRVIDRLVLRRYDYGRVFQRVEVLLSRTNDVPELLENIARELAPALAATRVYVETDALTDDLGSSIALVSLETIEEPRFRFSIGELAGGRELSPRDRKLLDDVATAAARRIDEIRLFSERARRRDVEEKLARLQKSDSSSSTLVDLVFISGSVAAANEVAVSNPDFARRTMQRVGVLLDALTSARETHTLARELEILRAWVQLRDLLQTSTLRLSIDVADRLHPLNVPALALTAMVIAASAIRVRGSELTVGASNDLDSGGALISVRGQGEVTREARERFDAILEQWNRSSRSRGLPATKPTVTLEDDGTLELSLRIPVDAVVDNDTASIA